MVAYFYRSNKKVRLTPEKRCTIAQEIKGLLRSYYHDLDEPKEEVANILNELFPGSSSTSNKINKIPSLYEQYKTYTSAIQRACYPSYEAILDVKGLDLQSNNVASTYKASLVYDWNLIDLMKKLDESNEDWTIKGEAAAYVCWKEEVIEVENEVPVVDYDNENMVPVLKTKVEKVPVQTFRAVDVKRIDPHTLYFDKSQADDWEHCKKIYRAFIPLGDVLANTSYSLTAQEKRELKELVYNSRGDLTNKYKTDISENTTVYGNTVEVLEFEGDYVDPETLEIYRRIEATVVAGKYLAKFEESRKPKSSIIWTAYMKRPDTGRGQSPLRIPEILNAVQNMCADLTLRSWQLNTYPTYLAPKGIMPKHVNLNPGDVIEYEPDLATQAGPQKMDFSSGLRGFDFSDFFQRRMESATGINQYMQGAMDGSVRTASEASYIHSGASMRMAREAHLFSHGFILPLVRRYALFKKVFDTYDREIPIGQDQYAEVNAEVRNGNYMFIIGGSQAQVEREAETQKLFTVLGLPAFQSLAQIMDPVTASEFLKWILNRMNFEGTSQIMDMMNLNGQLRQLAQQLGIQQNNINGFRDDMMNSIQGRLPELAEDLYQEGIARQNLQ